jgi:hypothetical protein
MHACISSSLRLRGMTGTVCQKSPRTTVTPPKLDFFINLAMCGPEVQMLPYVAQYTDNQTMNLHRCKIFAWQNLYQNCSSVAQ